jgi:hypothetical protein
MATSPQVNCQDGRYERGKASGQAVEGRLRLKVELQSRKRGSFSKRENYDQAPNDNSEANNS